MRALVRVVVLALTGLATVLNGTARAEEADDLTCRSRLSKDAVQILDSWVNAKIRETIDDANRRGGAGCDRACLYGELRSNVGGSYPNPVTMIPHSRFGGWVNDQKTIERCHLKFGETIYGAKSYNLPWMYPFNGRIIFIADSIRLAGRTVGLDKIDHFIREGLDHWRNINERSGGDIAASMAREVGSPGSHFAWTESGVKGMSLTGVFAYADLAAGFYGYRFWDELLSLGRPDSYVVYDAATRRYSQRRPFTFADYVNDAWDEGINYSAFDPKLAKEVEAALKKRALTLPVSDCHGLAKLPQAQLYVNPACLPSVHAVGEPPAAGVHSNWSWPVRFISVLIPSATSPSTARDDCDPRPRPFVMSWLKPSWPNGPASIRSVSASITAPTLRSRPPRSFWQPSPAEPSA
jgi:hypothetical protein